ncbi:MAG: hypothetical protein D6815_08520 [Candidatus Dadabacteria bacterium]|nr:MAG: hypothetical protein D6815_08520 [Candidatus Dadabacteria bacterium]
MIGCVQAASTGAWAWPYEIPAKWIGHTGFFHSGIRPAVNMILSTVSYVPGKGVLVAGTAILRIDDEGKPHVMLGTLRPAPGVYETPSEVTYTPRVGLLIAYDHSGFAPVEDEEGRIVRYRFLSYKHILRQYQDRWSLVDPPKVPDVSGDDWTIEAMMPARDGGVYVFGTNRGPMVANIPHLPRPRLEGARWLSRAFHYDGEQWRDLTPSGLGLVEFRSECRLSDHEIAVVGRVVKAREDGFLDRFDPWAAIYDELSGRWQVLPPPRPPLHPLLRWRFSHAACDRTKRRVWVSADCVVHEARSNWIFRFSQEFAKLYSYDGESGWRVYDLPERPEEEIEEPDDAFRAITALAVSPDGTPWIGLQTELERTAPVLRLVEGEWRVYPLPKVSGVSAYHPWSMGFDPRGEGWATAFVFGGAATGSAGPLLLRMRGDHWEQQNWTWSWWRQRGFGLFGPLR